MSKPEDISQDVWSAAESTLDDMLCNCIEASGTAEQFRIDSIVPIARAIMAAKAEQQEADAKIARDRAAICADACEKINAGELYQDVPHAFATENCARLEAEHIARLIERDPGAVPTHREAR